MNNLPYRPLWQRSLIKVMDQRSPLLALLFLPVCFLGFFKRIFGGKPDPSWSPFVENQDLKRFMDAVKDYFQQRSISYEVQPEGLIRLPEEDATLSLTNLAQNCARHDPARWRAIIAEHFDNLFAYRDAEEDPSSWSFEKVRPMLMVRLYHEGLLQEVPESHLVYRRDIPGTISVLAYDLPTVVQTVAENDLTAWGQSREELFQIALENTYQTYQVEGSWQELGDDIQAYVLIAEHFFVAPQALLLDRYPQCLGVGGALVGIPVRNVLLSYPIKNIKAAQAVTRLIVGIINMEREGPGSISPQLYWYNEGEFLNLPYQMERKKLKFYPPESFTTMLGELAQ